MNSREKGKRAERELAKLLSGYGFDCRRGQQFSGIEGEDVVGLPFVHIECKAVERLNVREAMNQSERDAFMQRRVPEEYIVPVVMHKKNRQPWLVTLNLDDFMTFYKAWLEKEEVDAE